MVSIQRRVTIRYIFHNIVYTFNFKKYVEYSIYLKRKICSMLEDSYKLVIISRSINNIIKIVVTYI